MAIINCPSCKEKISDKAKKCSNCHYDFLSQTSSQGLTNEQIASKQILANIKNKYSLQMHAMIGIILILLGSLLWYFGDRGTKSYSDLSSLGLLALGSLLYLVTRVRLILFRKQKK
jgi:uncharacterized membrane protein YvbJ